MAIGYGVACPKPEKRKTTKGRKLRAESAVKQSVRAQCVERDGDCRILKSAPTVAIAFEIFGECRGESEWAHMHSRRRSQTRNMAPDIRHDARHSLMLCTKHHQDYDAHKLKITSLTTRGADGPLKFRRAK